MPESLARIAVGATQLQPRPGVIELGWGQPDPALLPGDAIAEAAARVLREAGGAALSYGRDQGPAALERWLVARHRDQGTPAEVGEVFITTGASTVLDGLCAAVSRPGDCVLVEQRTYDLAARLFRDRGLVVVPIACDADGILPVALDDALQAHSAAGVAFVYLIPTFNNPTGSLLPASRREQIGSIAARRDVLVVEDDAYRDLWGGVAPPAPIRAHARDHVVTVGTFSKSIAPGLRVGWALGPMRLVEALRGAGLTASGGCAAQLPAMVVAGLAASGEADALIERSRAIYNARRRALARALERHAPPTVAWREPPGGFFYWLSLSERLPARELAAVAEQQHGVSCIVGDGFEPGGATNGIRVSISRYGEVDLEVGVRRLAGAMRAVEAGLGWTGAKAEPSTPHGA